ncbi:MAG: YfbU family protein [Nitrospira sp.]|nr:YfbU family protein [Nitrospira sp.]
MQLKTERFEMRLDSRTLERVDAWRVCQSDLPSRAEAIRRLMGSGLSEMERKPLKLSDGEKLITLMLCELYKPHKIEGDIDPLFVKEALLGGHYWGLKWEYPSIFHGHEDNSATVHEVVNVLDMWSFLEESYAVLSKKDKDHIAKEAEPFGKRIVFRGFDGNNETEHLLIARFLIDKLDRFTRFKGRDLNIHTPRIRGYQRMVKVFEPIRPNLGPGNLLGAEAIIKILNAQRNDDV